MDLRTEHVRPVDESVGSAGNRAKFHRRIADDARGGLVPCAPDGVTDGIEQLTIQIIGDAVVHNLVDDHRRAVWISGEGEGLPKKIRDRPARAERRLNARRRQRCRFKSDEPRSGVPSGIVKSHIAPARPRIARRLREFPNIAVAHHRHRRPRADLRISIRLDLGELRVTRRAPCKLARAPVAEIIHAEIHIAQHERVPRPISARWPAPAVAVAQRANCHAILVIERDALAVVIQHPDPRSEDAHRRRDRGIRRASRRLVGGTHHDALERFQEMRLRRAAVEIRHGESDAVRERPLRHVQRRHRDIRDFDEFRFRAGREVVDLAENDLFRTGEKSHRAREDESSDGESQRGTRHDFLQSTDFAILQPGMADFPVRLGAKGTCSHSATPFARIRAMISQTPCAPPK